MHVAHERHHRVEHVVVGVDDHVERRRRAASRSASVTMTATSIRASRRRSSPVISQSIHTSRSRHRSLTADAIRRRLPWRAATIDGGGGPWRPNCSTQDAIDDRLEDRHPDWQGSPEKLSRSIEFADFPTAVEFVNASRRAARSSTTTPTSRCAGAGWTSSSSTHSAGGVTDLDLTLAGIVDEVAAGATAGRGRLTGTPRSGLAAPGAHAEHDQPQLALGAIEDGRRRPRGGVRRSRAGPSRCRAWPTTISAAAISRSSVVQS